MEKMEQMLLEKLAAEIQQKNRNFSFKIQNCTFFVMKIKSRKASYYYALHVQTGHIPDFRTNRAVMAAVCRDDRYYLFTDIFDELIDTDSLNLPENTMVFSDKFKKDLQSLGQILNEYYSKIRVQPKIPKKIRGKKLYECFDPALVETASSAFIFDNRRCFFDGHGTATCMYTEDKALKRIVSGTPLEEYVQKMLKDNDDALEMRMRQLKQSETDVSFILQEMEHDIEMVIQRDIVRNKPKSYQVTYHNGSEGLVNSRVSSNDFWKAILKQKRIQDKIWLPTIVQVRDGRRIVWTESI